MKKVFIMGLFMSSALVLTGCEDIPGVLTVSKTLNVLVKGKSKTVVAGSYQTSLDFKRSKVVATIETASDKLKVELQVPDGAQIPDNGNFELKSAQSGQPFDVLGSVSTVVTESERQTGRETCQYQDYDVVCGTKGCVTVPVTRQGLRSIEYFDRTTDQRMKFDMDEIGNAKSKYASFDGQAHFSERIKTREGQCF